MRASNSPLSAHIQGPAAAFAGFRDVGKRSGRRQGSLCRRATWCPSCSRRASRITLTTGLSAPTENRDLPPAAGESVSLLVPRFHPSLLAPPGAGHPRPLTLFKKKLSCLTINHFARVRGVHANYRELFLKAKKGLRGRGPFIFLFASRRQAPTRAGTRVWGCWVGIPFPWLSGRHTASGNSAGTGHSGAIWGAPFGHSGAPLLRT